jgi:Concanavalin A-like lectin/glucanases superfamily/PEP-CTERM motif
MSFSRNAFVLVLGLTAFSAMAAPVPVAVYNFDNTLDSSVAGAPSLVKVDPNGLSGFSPDTVFGVSESVYNFVGSTANSNQSGLTLNTTGLLSDLNVYTVEMVFKFTERQNAWRRIFDVQNRQSDNGFYVNPGNNLEVYPIGGGSPFANGIYHDVFLTVNNGSVSFYLDGSAQATVSTGIMADSQNIMGFFLDNVAGGGQGEYSSGSVAQIKLYDAALSATDITPVANVPEPQTYALTLAGLGMLLVVRRRRAA